MKKILSFCILSLLIISAAAQVPNTFHFQGALKDVDGIPVNDTKFIEFRIYDAETDGIMLWNEGPVAVEIINGLFSLELGSTNPFPEDLFDASPLYMTFALASGEMEPRQKMLAVPFALKAASSDEDWQISGDYIINLNDSVGIGTANPHTRFEVNAIMRLTPAGMTEICDITLEGSIYYDMNLKEYCFCDGENWKQLDGGGYCDCVDLDGDGADICDPGHPYDTDGLIADCDDDNININPGIFEICSNGIDDDCDGLIDIADPDCNQASICSACIDNSDCASLQNAQCIELDGGTHCLSVCLDPGDCPTGYICQDLGGGTSYCLPITASCTCSQANDGEIRICENTNQYGTCSGTQTCDGLSGWSPCDAQTPVPEICDDLIDNDCDGDIDGDDSDCNLCTDSDSDGYGVCPDCGIANGCTYDGDDCDDGNSNTNPGASETWYDGIDQNCDGWNDFDQDMDGYVDIAYPGEVGGTSPYTGDCDDTDPDINPEATEIPGDGIDQDCNDVDAVTCYIDEDVDGYGNNGGSTVIALDGSCDAAQQESDNDLDCDDNDANINPGAPEIPGDGIDQNCDMEETCFMDNDDDGYRPDGTSTVTSIDMDCNDAGEAIGSDPIGDCNDADPNINPAAIEICDNGIDDDCDELADGNDPDCNACAGAPNGTQCDDGDPCTENDECQNGVCQGTPIICAPLDQCHDLGSCDQGNCVYPTSPNGTNCDDGNACTENDQCNNGMCQGTLIDCNDGNANTFDYCDSGTGCYHEPNNAPTASFTANPNPAITNQDISFNASASSDPDGGDYIDTYEWDWNDDGTFDQSLPSPTVLHQFGSPGFYDVTLRVSDSQGLTDTFTLSIEVQ